MTTAVTEPSPTTASGRPGWGLAMLLLLVSGFAVAMTLAGTDAPTPGAAPTLPAASPGFRADAWLLPDDPTLGFVEIPGGPFLMGSQPATDRMAYDNERWPETGGARSIEVPRYFIGRYEVTVGQYQVFTAATGHRAAELAADTPFDHPVSGVSWPDALAYGRWLTGVMRDDDRIPVELDAALDLGWRVTLPTEAQWEKAARGTDGRVFPWGNVPRTDRARVGAAGPVRVGAIACPECPFGLTDMAGNVWELTRSPFGPYGQAEITLETDALWIMRGGHFGDPLQNVRAAVRGGADPGARRSIIGFRVALAAP